MRPLISPRELAQAIGVSESSLKRWADDGKIEVSRTAGGHRRIAMGEAIRFVRSIRAPLLHPEILGLTDLSEGAQRAVSAESDGQALFELLQEGRAREARGLILTWYLSGQSVVEIADGPVREAMERLGALWRHDAAGVYIEHRATDICIQAVQQLRQFAERDESSAVAIGGAPPGDPYLMPSILAAAALADLGWQAVNLGPDTPFESFLRAAQEQQPRLIWMSISSVRDLRETNRGVKNLAAQLGAMGIAFVIGGQAARLVDLPDDPNLSRGDTLRELVAIADNLKQTSPALTRAAGEASELHRPEAS